MSVNEGLINTVVQHKYLALVQHIFSEGNIAFLRSFDLRIIF